MPLKYETITDADLRRYEHWERFLEPFDERAVAWDERFSHISERMMENCDSRQASTGWAILGAATAQGVGLFLFLLLIVCVTVAAGIWCFGMILLNGVPLVLRRLIPSSGVFMPSAKTSTPEFRILKRYRERSFHFQIC